MGGARAAWERRRCGGRWSGLEIIYWKAGLLLM